MSNKICSAIYGLFARFRLLRFGNFDNELGKSRNLLFLIFSSTKVFSPLILSGRTAYLPLLNSSFFRFGKLLIKLKKLERSSSGHLVTTISSNEVSCVIAVFTFFKLHLSMSKYFVFSLSAMPFLILSLMVAICAASTSSVCFL